MNGNRKLFSQGLFSMFTMLAVVSMLGMGAQQAEAQGLPCAAQNWAASTPNVWAATVSDTVMLNNDPATNRPTIPTMLYDGTYSPWGYTPHPQAVTQLNTNWSCPSGTPLISVAGAGRETVAFQIFITAPAASTLTSVSVGITSLTGPGTLTSDNTGKSNVTRYLEGYVPYSCTGAASIGCVQATGSIPDPLIPFYDPYDSGSPAVATPFNVQQGTTQGVWVDVSIPASQAAGTYSGTVTISGNGIATQSIPLQVTVWSGNLPAFDAGSINATYADMLKVWLPLYSVDAGEGISGSDVAIFQKYQVMAHNYDVDTQYDPYAPAISGDYPSGENNGTSFTTNGTTSSIDWTAYDAQFGPSLTPGGLFTDGTAMRVLDSPIANGGAGAWTYGYTWCMYNCADAPLMPAGLVSLTQNYATQISQHFSANHAAHGWAVPDLLSYTFDENYNVHSYQLGDQPLVYQIISQVDQAINASNSSLSATWAASTAPIRTLMTDEPACMEDGDTTYYTPAACADHLNLSYPGGAQATPGYTTSWVTAWSPNPSIYMTGQPGPALSYGVDPTIIAGTGYQYTMDLTQGVPALSTAPAPIEKWTYNNGGGGSGGMSRRATYWAAYKYGQDVTTPSVGDPSPAAPSPGGVWSWIGDFWGGYSGTASASSCNTLSPYIQNGGDQGDSYFFPGNELGCYYTGTTVGAASLTASPAVNTSCAANGYSVCNGISGPVATRELEQWRRGYEDYEYLYLYGKQAGRAAAQAVVASVAAEGMADWEAYDWENIDGGWYEYGVTPVGTAYSGNCTWPNPINSPIFGNLPNGLPNGPTGQGSSGPAFGYAGCEPLYSPDPAAYENARIRLAQALGFAPATTPNVTGLSPSSGLNTGGTSVIIAGTNFSSATGVQFGGVNAASFVVNSAAQITAVSPAGNGTVDVQVFGPGGDSLPNNSDLYTFVSPVTVTALSPSQGVAVGGNSVNLTGTDFAAGAVVMFGNNEATNVVVNSASSITATAPSGSGSVYVTVTTSQGTSASNSSNLYAYEVPPAVTGVSPNTGSIPGGTSVTLSGSGFVSGMAVHFGANAASGVSVGSSTSATATSPAGSSNSGGAVDVTVTTANGTSTINGGDQFTYTSPVTVTGLNVHSGPPAGGTSVVITGTDFTAASTVKFGGNSASSTFNSATQITATSPAGGGTVDVTVTTSPYSSAPARGDQFSYGSAVTGGIFATLPTTNVGSASSSQNVSVKLASASAISSITVPKAQNGVQEFTVGTISGCTVGGTVNAANTVCTVAITFHPQYPGVRLGTLMVNNDNAVVGTAGLAGIGQGPQVAETPGSLVRAIGGGVSGVTNVPQSVTTAALGVSNNGAGLAMDGAGNLYIADDVNCMAYEVVAATNQIVAVAGNYNFSSGAVTPSTTPEPALGSNTCPQGIAVDGAGNIYIIDVNTNDGSNPNEVEEVSAATGQIFVMAGGGTVVPSTTPEAATSAKLNAVNSLATDGSGNLYIADFYNNLVEKVTPAGQIVVVAGGGSTAPSTTPEAATSAQMSGPTGMVVDDLGNLYISDQNISVIDKVNSSGQIVAMAGGGGNAPTTTPQAALSVALNNPAGLAVDGAGDLYIADFSSDIVERVNQAGQLVVVAGGGGNIADATPQPSTSAEFGNIEGIEVDGAGNLYIADGQDIGGGDNMVEKVSTTAPLSFPYTNVGSTSVPQSINVMDIGNQSLTFTSVSAATDFPLQSGGTCTMNATTGQTLASSVGCSLSYAFHPTTGGVLNETANLNDNNLNVGGSQQGIPLTGTGVGGTNPQLTSIGPGSGTTGTSVTVTGTNLSGATEMTFGSSPVTPSSSTSTTVTANAPAGSGTVNVTVTTSSGTSNAEPFTYTASPAATPTFNPGAGTYTSTQTVTIGDATSGATIYYTTNGTTPTTSSTVYTAPISVSTSETVEAIATASGYTNSAVGSAAYTINLTTVATPTFSPVAGTYNTTQTVTISDATSGSTIYYTTNGTTPTTSSTVYSSPISVAVTETVKALATKAGDTNSAIGSAVYTLTAATPTFSPVAGTYTSAQTVTVSDATPGVTMYYTTNGSTPTTSSTVYSAPISVAVTETIKVLATKTGYTNSAVGSAAYTINLTTVATPTFSPVAGTYNTTQTVTISDATSGSTIYYTTNGTTPTTSSTVYSSPISVAVTETVKALATKSGYTNSAIGSAVYTLTAATPTFSPVAGTYTSTQTVTVSDATPGVSMYYTTNGTTPTTSSTVYSAPISVTVTETIKVLATKTGYTNSTVGSAAYTISGSGSLAANSDFATTPPMTPGGGIYTYDPTNVSGWTFSSTSGVAENGSAWNFTTSPDNANQVAFLQNTSTITQTITGLTTGNQYAVSYYLEDRPSYPSNPITVTVGGTTLLSTSPGSGWTLYSEPFTATATSEVLTFSTNASGGDNDDGLSDVTVTASSVVATPTFSPVAGTYTSIQSVTISDATSGATIYYTTNGTTPTTSSSVYSSPIGVSSSETIKALGVKSGYTNSAIGSAAYVINLSPDITTIAGVQAGTTNPTSGTVAYGNTMGAPNGVAIAPVINGAGGDVYFDNSNNYNLYVIYKGGAAANAILAIDGIASPVVGDVYQLNLGLNETGPWQLKGLFVDSYGNLLISDPGYNRVYMLYAGTVTGQGTNPADALLTADGAAGVGSYGLHAGYLYHVIDGNSYPHGVWVDSKENVFYTDGYGNGLVEVVYNATGTSAHTILTAEGYTTLTQGTNYIIAGGQSTATYPYDNDGGSSVAYNGSTSTANTAINNPWGIYGDAAGDLIFADNSSNKIKKLSGTTAVLSTIGGPAAGTATTVGHGGDGGPATSAQMNAPIGVVLDAGGNIYFADSANSSVRMIATGGNISTVAGTSGTSGTYTGEGGFANSAVMNTTYFLSIDGSGNIYVADSGNDLLHVF